MVGYENRFSQNDRSSHERCPDCGSENRSSRGQNDERSSIRGSGNSERGQYGSEGHDSESSYRSGRGGSQSWDRESERGYGRSGSQGGYGGGSSSYGGSSGYGGNNDWQRRESYERGGSGEGYSGRSDFGSGRSDMGNERGSFGGNAYGGGSNRGGMGWPGSSMGQASMGRSPMDQSSMGSSMGGLSRSPTESFGGGSFRGKGPKGYKRSDSTIREDICDRLTDDDSLDASNIDCQVKDGEVTLSGTVSCREDKRRAEDIVASAAGVSDVENRIRVQRESSTSDSHSLGSQSSGERSREYASSAIGASGASGVSSSGSGSSILGTKKT